jgi:glutathione S-transferase
MPVTLVTIPFSHYCEKARWALERAQIRHAEEAWLPLLHLVPARRAGRGATSTPVLVTPHGSVQDSTEIVRWVDRQLAEPDRLFPEGPTGAEVEPAWQTATFRAGLPVMRGLLRRAIGVTPERAARALGRVEAVFAEVAERLADGRRYLTGERFTAADLTFAALATPVTFPPEHERHFLSFADAPPGARGTLAALRDSVAGRFALRLYREERALTVRR